MLGAKYNLIRRIRNRHKAIARRDELAGQIIAKYPELAEVYQFGSPQES